MKNIKSLGALFLISYFVFAGVNPVIAESGGIRISSELKEYSQNPEGKVLKYEMILNSEVRSDNVRVTWTVRGNVKFVDATKAIRRFGVESGEAYTIPIEIVPTGSGTAELTGKAEVFQVDGTLTSTVRTNFVINEELEKLPLTDEYNNAKSLSSIKNIITTLATIGAIAAIGLFVFRKALKWYNKKPEVKFEDSEQQTPTQTPSL